MRELPLGMKAVEDGNEWWLPRWLEVHSDVSGDYGVSASRERLGLWRRKKGALGGFECLDQSHQSVWHDHQ
jgi:hypothetical protein